MLLGESAVRFYINEECPNGLAGRRVIAEPKPWHVEARPFGSRGYPALSFVRLSSAPIRAIHSFVLRIYTGYLVWSG